MERNLTQKENTRHGEQLFPLQKHLTHLNSLHPMVTAHWHEEVEWTYIHEGSGTYQIGLNSYKVESGDFLFLPPAMLHSIFVREGEELRSETYVFHLNFLGLSCADVCSVQYLTPIRNQTLLPPFVIRKSHPAYGELLRSFQEARSAYGSALPGYELILKARFLLLINALLPYCEKSSPIRARDEEHVQKLKTVLEYIEVHYDEELSIKQLSGLCYFSEYHFMRFFKKYVGLSCLDYIKNLRLKKAAELLACGGSAMEASMAVGFRNLSYFHREFKKRYGMTPKKFRQQYSTVFH